MIAPFLLAQAWVPFAPPQRIVVDTSVKATVPESLVVPRGARIVFTGKVQGEGRRTFFALAGTERIAETTAAKEWRMEWSTAEWTRAETPIELFWRQGGDARSFARLVVRVLQTNPYRINATFDPASAAVVARATGDPVPLSVIWTVDGTPVAPTALAIDGASARIFPEAAAAGVRKLAGIVTLASGARIPLPELLFTVPALARTVAETTAIELGLENRDALLRGKVDPIGGFPFVPERLLVDGADRGPVAADGTWSLPAGDLAEGDRRIAVRGKGAGRTVTADATTVTIRYSSRYAFAIGGDRLVRQLSTAVPSLALGFWTVIGVFPPGAAERLVTWDGETFAERAEGRPLGPGDWATFEIARKLHRTRVDARPSAALAKEDLPKIDVPWAAYGKWDDRLAALAAVLGPTDHPSPGLDPAASAALCADRATGTLAAVKEIGDLSRELAELNAAATALGAELKTPFLPGEDRGMLAQKRLRAWLLPRVVFWEWLRDVHAILPAEWSATGSADGLRAALEATPSERLKDVATRLGKGRIVQDWTRRGFAATDGMRAADAATLDKIRLMLSAAFADFADASAKRVRLATVRLERDRVAMEAESEERDRKLAGLDEQIDEIDAAAAEAFDRGWDGLDVARTELATTAQELFEATPSR